MRTCSKCGCTRPASEFNHRICRPCKAKSEAERRARWRETMGSDYNEYQRAYRARDPEKWRAYARDKHLRSTGITPERFDLLLAEQDGRCAICRSDAPGGKGRWHVDHDHACCAGKSSCGTCVRGLLCFACNVALGYFKDDPERLRGALEYLNQSARIGGTS